MFQAVLSNPDHPDYGVVTIPFPIPHDQYAHCIYQHEAEIFHAGRHWRNGTRLLHGAICALAPG